VERFVLISYLRARPDSTSAYLDSKWRAEELVRASALDYTVVKPGLLYGKGDQLIGNLAPTLRAVPVFATVGLQDPPVRPVAIEDFVKVLVGALEGRLSRQTVAVVGPESLPMGEVASRIGRAVGRRTLVLPLPVWVHSLLAVVLESLMKVPLVGRAQVRMLSEGMAEPLPERVPLPRGKGAAGDGETRLCQPLPADLEPTLLMSVERIRAVLA
jgi:NADH dehydrogenase